MMDQLYENRDLAQQMVRHASTQLVGGHVDVCFFDVTTLYFESFEQDELRDFGYSKDQKFHQTQVVLALATTDNALPIGYKLFHGAQAEITTLIECLNAWKQQGLQIGHVTFVADRGMMTRENLAMLEKENCTYIVGAKLRKLPAKMQQQILDTTQYRAAELASEPTWVREFSFENRRLICSYSPSRARKDADLSIVKRTKLGKTSIRAKQQGTQADLDSNDSQAQAVRKTHLNRGYLKYIQVKAEARQLNEKNRTRQAVGWMHGVITNCDLPELETLFVIANCGQSKIFRIHKHDFKCARFTTHAARMKHTAICFLAYALVRHTIYHSVAQETNECGDEKRATCQSKHLTRYANAHRLLSRMCSVPGHLRGIRPETLLKPVCCDLAQEKAVLTNRRKENVVPEPGHLLQKWLVDKRLKSGISIYYNRARPVGESPGDEIRSHEEVLDEEIRSPKEDE